MKQYPSDNLTDLQSVITVLTFIMRERTNDVTDWNNLKQVFIGGRKVNKTPTSFSDVDPNTDAIGDFNITPTFGYYLVNDAGTAKWTRWAVDSAW